MLFRSISAHSNPQISFFSNFFIKNGSHGTIYTFKNYFATVISAISFQFQQNKSYPNRPRSSELLKFKWKSHLKHYSIESTCKPQSLMSSIPSHICSHFSILNQNLTLNLRSLRSLYSQSQVSLVSNLKSQPFTD